MEHISSSRYPENKYELSYTNLVRKYSSSLIHPAYGNTAITE